MEELEPGHAVVVSDYMMKLTFQKLYEPQRDRFGKKGVSLHGMMFLFKEGDMGLVTEYHDTFSVPDDTQSWFCSESCLEECAKAFKSLHPNIESVTLSSDNGSHYKNTSLVLWLRQFYSLI